MASAWHLLSQASATGTELTITQGDRTVRMQVVIFGHYAARLTADVAALIRGERQQVNEKDYRLEWFLYVLALLPVGIPIITVGGALPAALGAGLAAGNAAVAQQEKLSMAARVGIMVGLSAAGYVALFLLLSALRG
jgi:hypothetical protein